MSCLEGPNREGRLPRTVQSANISGSTGRQGGSRPAERGDLACTSRGARTPTSVVARRGAAARRRLRLAAIESPPTTPSTFALTGSSTSPSYGRTAPMAATRSTTLADKKPVAHRVVTGNGVKKAGEVRQGAGDRAKKGAPARSSARS